LRSDAMRPTGAQTTGVQNPALAGIDIGKQLTESVSGLRTTLGSIADAASAQAALPKLQQTAAQIDQVSDQTERLSADQRQFVNGLAAKLLPTLNKLFDQVLAVPGVPDELKPTIEALRNKITRLAT